MSITLYIDHPSTLHQTFSDSIMNLQTEAIFKRAVVTKGTWIFYTYPNFNDKEDGGNKSNYKILEPGKDEDEDITLVNGSMYLIKDDMEGVILFEHYYYGGKRMLFVESCEDVNKAFESVGGYGVSSAIVLPLSGSFTIFTKPNYEGLESVLTPGTRYEKAKDMGFLNDKLQSLIKM